MITFFIFINGLLNLNFDAYIICFADDTVTLLNEKSAEYLYIKANQVFKIVKMWFNNNFLEINLSKTKYFFSI